MGRCATEAHSRADPLPARTPDLPARPPAARPEPPTYLPAPAHQPEPSHHPPQQAPRGPARLIIGALAALVLVAGSATAVVLLRPDGLRSATVNTPTTSTWSQPTRPAASPRVTSRQPDTTATAPAVIPLPVGSWITVLESLPQQEFSQEQAAARATSLSVAGYPVSVIDSDTVPGLNSGYWALGVPGSSSREAAVALCGVFGRQAGGTCYPRQVG